MMLHRNYGTNMDKMLHIDAKMQCWDDSRRSAGLNILTAFMVVLLLKEARALKLLTFYGIVRVANESKAVICLPLTFRHSVVTRVRLTSSEEMSGQGYTN